VRGWGRECRENEEGTEVQKMETYEKYPKNATYLADALWGPPPRVIRCRKLFSGTPFPPQIVYLCLEPFKSNRASKLTIIKKSLQKFNVFGITADIPGGYHPAPYTFRKNFSRATFASQIVCFYLESLRSYLPSKLTVLEKYSKIQHIWPY